MNKQLKDFTQQECYAQYLRMRAHSDRKWRSSLLLQRNDKGGAISSQIISIEELIKALIMFLDSKGTELRKVDSMEIILRRSHSFRHFIGFTFFVIGIFMDDLKEFLIKSKEDPSILIDLGKNLGKIKVLAKWYFLRKIPSLKKEFIWFSKVEALRQNGNHVDYDLAIKSPQEFNSDDYQEVYKRLNSVRNVIRYFIMSIEKDGDENFFSTHFNKPELEKAEMFKQLDEEIKSLTKSRARLFNTLESKFFPLKSELFK